MTENRAELILRAVEIGRHLVKICDTLKQPVAGNHISCGINIIEAHADLEATLAAEHCGESPVD